MGSRANGSRSNLESKELCLLGLIDILRATSHLLLGASVAQAFAYLQALASWDSASPSSGSSGGKRAFLPSRPVAKWLGHWPRERDTQVGGSPHSEGV